MALRTSTLRPGFLVSLKSSISGNVKYATRTIEAERITDDGAKRARWETERVVTDPREHELATEARGKARHAVSRICAASAFGLLCPEDRAADLEEAIAEARRIAEDFNATAAYSRISVYVIAGRIAADDVEAMRAINSEVTELLRAMENGVQNLDAAAIREAANKAKSLGAMLTPAAAARMQEAIDAARSAARQIIKAGETAAVAVDAYALRRIASARTEFLDMGDAVDVAAPSAGSRAIDMEPETEAAPEETQGAEIKTAAARDWDMSGDGDEPRPMLAAAAAPSLFAGLEF